MVFKVIVSQSLFVLKNVIHSLLLAATLSKAVGRRLFFEGKDANTKGQLISKCPFGIFKSSKKPMKLFLGFLP